MNSKYYKYFVTILLLLGFVLLCLSDSYSLNFGTKVGQKIDSLNGVYVYYNGRISNVSKRNVTKDGYNLGLEFQCVEFVKRYYYERLNHKMPNSYGNAKDFFDSSLKDGQRNPQRNLYQYHNGSSTKPKVHDLIVFDGTIFNKYGHVAIISGVGENYIEIIQQNAGMFSNSRETYGLSYKNSEWGVHEKRVLGWLSLE